jgi:hypothetical protein
VTEAKQCRSCQTWVWFLRNDSTGRVAPIEVIVPDDHRGNCSVDLEAGTYRVLHNALGHHGGDIHRNHFASCPAASRWHKR